MASSSSAKKKAVATKRSKNAKPITSGTSKARKPRVVKVQRGNGSVANETPSLRRNKPATKTTKSEKARKAVVLPPDWPVTSQALEFPAEASALRPGSLLRNSCSGSDIQLARSACAPVNFDKGKGKFLLVFPGKFSFGGSDNSNSNNSDNRNQEDSQQDNDSDDVGDLKPKATSAEEKSGDTETLCPVHDGNIDNTTTTTTNAEKTGSSSSNINTNINSSNNRKTTMGRIEGLRTDSPSFRIPFPQLNKSLVFPGKKITTTSKYLALSCSNKKKGTVQCKNIFSSAIVFGMPRWEAMSLEGRKDESVSRQIPSATTSASIDTAKEDHPITQTNTNGSDDNEDDGKIIRPPFLHYGGSERTLDGATRSRSNATNKSTDLSKIENEKDRVPIWSNYSTIDGYGNDKPPSAFDFSSMSTTKATAPPFNKKQKTIKSHDSFPENGSHDDDDETNNEKESDSDSDASFTIGRSKRRKPTTSATSTITTSPSSKTSQTDNNNNPLLSATKTRSAPRRQASMKKKRYMEGEKEESSNDDDDDDRSISDDGEDSSAKRGSEDEEVQVVDKEGESLTKKDKRISRKATHSSSRKLQKAKNGAKGVGKISVAKKEIIDVDTDDDNDDDNDSDSSSSVFADGEESSASAGRRVSVRRKSSGKKCTSYKEINESDIDETMEEDSETEDEIKNNNSSSQKKNSKAGKGRQEKMKKSPQASSKPRGRSKSVTTNESGSRKRKASQPRSKRGVSVTRSKKPRIHESANSSSTRDDAKAKIIITQSPSSLASPLLGVKNPFRRRHKKASPARKVRTGVLDLTRDDEFAFG
uniref:Uncharacterized protein n=1 Tax=Pseudo-nitzschia australis TaxID=44445 RepID=A0A7S4ACV9_9STRA|mmetsp:Transcript_21460/g.45580  ORF Transcript_21460/g.45580 Transcript_21460/m.45580 type:complete len:815 (-) Transcript_21460:197-2641(-)